MHYVARASLAVVRFVSKRKAATAAVFALLRPNNKWFRVPRPLNCASRHQPKPATDQDCGRGRPRSQGSGDSLKAELRATLGETVKGLFFRTNPSSGTVPSPTKHYPCGVRRKYGIIRAAKGTVLHSSKTGGDKLCPHTPSTTLAQTFQCHTLSHAHRKITRFCT